MEKLYSLDEVRRLKLHNCIFKRLIKIYYILHTDSDSFLINVSTSVMLTNKETHFGDTRTYKQQCLLFEGSRIYFENPKSKVCQTQKII